MKELRDGLKRKGQHIPDAYVARLVAATDVNGDGIIDYEVRVGADILVTYAWHDDTGRPRVAWTAWVM